MSVQDVIAEYLPRYCHSLEAVYGEGMMSEGGEEAIDAMFQGLQIEGKKALDIGAGLGGVAYYLAREYGMDVTGLEINPWMVDEAMTKRPADLKEHLRFVQNEHNDNLPFSDSAFDIIYSKGALCHVEDKRGLFLECYRILKPGGLLVINDWLSPSRGQWGGYVQRMVELESLCLYPETIDGYLEQLRFAQFRDVDRVNHSEKYAEYNEEIVRELKTEQKQKSFIRSFSEKLHAEAVEGYSCIAQAMRVGEGLVIQFTAHKY